MNGVPVVIGIVLAWAGITFPVENPRITGAFGATSGAHYNAARRHQGVDVVPYGGATGRAVLAPANGVVHRVYYSHTTGWVVVLAIQAPATFWATSLAGQVHTIAQGETFFIGLKHHQRVLVTEGQRVTSGQTIAAIGSTGSTSTGAHVHMELRIGPRWTGGYRLDPLDFFLAFIPELRPHLTARGWRGR
ncbi:MAG: M23 family metallopeptidase [Trueperaceae bacterium]|nr:M23 family metallopeptidase [Trueperaceae bacterium]